MGLRDKTNILFLLCFLTINLVVYWQYKASFVKSNFSMMQLVRFGERGSNLIGGDRLPPMIIDFEGFDNQNESNSRSLIVPNIVHYIFMNSSTIRFHEMICIFAVYLNHKPDAILIHCENCSFAGRYWERIERVKDLRRIIHFNQLPIRRSIFGAVGKTAIYHRSVK